MLFWQNSSKFCQQGTTKMEKNPDDCKKLPGFIIIKESVKEKTAKLVIFVLINICCWQMKMKY